MHIHVPEETPLGVAAVLAGVQVEGAQVDILQQFAQLGAVRVGRFAHVCQVRPDEAANLSTAPHT